MNLWKISQDENDGYDTFDSIIVAAETEEEARVIHPGKGFDREPVRYGSWCKSPEAVKVERIGVAVEGTLPGIILASFNGG